jgi:hypothetical protein
LGKLLHSLKAISDVQLKIYEDTSDSLFKIDKLLESLYSNTDYRPVGKLTVKRSSERRKGGYYHEVIETFENEKKVILEKHRSEFDAKEALRKIEQKRETEKLEHFFP